MSGAHPPPRTRMALPLTLKRRWPLSVSSEAICCMPKRTSCWSEISHQAPRALAGGGGYTFAPGEGAVVGLGGEHPARKSVERLPDAGHGELVGGVGPRALIRARHELAVQPHVCAVIDPVEMQPEGPARPRGGDLKLRAVPPGGPEGAIRRHREGREVLPDRISRSGDGPEVRSEVGVGVHLVLDEGRENRGRNDGRVPTVRPVAWLRQGGSGLSNLR